MSVQQLVGPFGSLKHRIVAVALHDQQGRLPDVAVVNDGSSNHGRRLCGIKVNALRCRRMGKRPTLAKPADGSATSEPKPVGPPLPLRRRLRALSGVELWHIEEPKTQGQRVPTIRYLVKRGQSEAAFNRPHEAWRYFQKLTGTLDKDPRPEPPPIDAAAANPSRPRVLHRRRLLGKKPA